MVSTSVPSVPATDHDAPSPPGWRLASEHVLGAQLFVAIKLWFAVPSGFATTLGCCKLQMEGSVLGDDSCSGAGSSNQFVRVPVLDETVQIVVKVIWFGET